MEGYTIQQLVSMIGSPQARDAYPTRATSMGWDRPVEPLPTYGGLLVQIS